MNQANKHYEAAFKLDVARMVVDQGLSVVQVVNGMKIGRTAVRRWVGQYRAEQWGKPGIGKPPLPDCNASANRRRRAGN